MAQVPTTGELVRSAQAGAPAAFAELAERHLRAAFACALAVVGNVADAEDIAQEALVTALQELSTCRDPERFSGWLLQIVRNRALNDLAKRQVRRLHAVRERAEGGDAQVTALLDTDVVLRTRLLEALATLPPVQREIVLLHDLDGWTHAELATQLKISEGMSRQHLFNARHALRSLLADGEIQETSYVL